MKIKDEMDDGCVGIKKALIAEISLCEKFKTHQYPDIDFGVKAFEDFQVYSTDNVNPNFDVFKKIEIKSLNKECHPIAQSVDIKELKNWPGYNAALSYIQYLSNTTFENIDPVNSVYYEQDPIHLINIIANKDSSIIDRMDDCFPIDYKNWLKVVETFDFEKQKIWLKSIIASLEYNIKIAERREGVLPLQYYDALDNYRMRYELIKERKELNVSESLRANDKKFPDILLCGENIKENVLLKLKAQFTGATGKKCSTILIALHKLRWIALEVRGKQTIYDMINTYFGLSLKNQSYQKYIKFDGNGELTPECITEAEIQNIIRLLHE